MVSWGMDFRTCDFSARIRKEAVDAFPEWQIFLSLDPRTRMLRVVIVPRAERILPLADPDQPEVLWLPAGSF